MELFKNLKLSAQLQAAAALPTLGLVAMLIYLGAATEIGLAVPVIIAALGALAGVVVAVLASGMFKQQWTDLNNLVGALLEERYQAMPEQLGRNELGQLAQQLLRLQTQLGDSADVRQLPATAPLLVKALEVCDTNVMVADADMNIVYMNQSVDRMLHDVEADVQKTLPNFRADTLVGTNVDVFHKDPSHQREMLKRLRGTHHAEIEIGELTFGLIATPIHDERGNLLGTVVEWDNKTDTLAREEEQAKEAAGNLRIRKALDNVTTNVMIADNDGQIIYMNESVTDMMHNAEADLRKDLPNFNASRLIGANFDEFHKNPAHQRNLLSRLTDTYETEIQVGGRQFRLIANPVMDGDKRVGSVVEWSDRTEEVAIEREINRVVEAAGKGDFSQQIDVSNKDGFFLRLGQGLNRVIETVEVALNDIQRMLGAMSKGDLTEKITRDYQGSFAKLTGDANATAAKLTEVIGSIRNAATAIASAAGEIAQGNADLSQRTEEQASSLEETASSMEQMTSTVQKSTENVRQVSEIASETQQRAREGGEVVARAVEAMAEINQSSKKIADIISVIDEIAFQTNLLALNAAVEAARAGEQGRGFAVVAGEVRNLAQRSAAAAKEIKDLIRDSVNKVSDGSALVNQSGETLNALVEAVEKVNSWTTEIAEAAEEQTAGIEQVNTAVAQMDEMTQQNAALVEEASAAGEAMSEQANNLNSMMDFFIVDTSEIAAAPLQPTAPKAVKAASQPAKAPGGKGVSASDDEWEEF